VASSTAHVSFEEGAPVHRRGQWQMTTWRGCQWSWLLPNSDKGKKEIAMEITIEGHSVENVTKVEGAIPNMTQQRRSDAAPQANKGIQATRQSFTPRFASVDALNHVSSIFAFLSVATSAKIFDHHYVPLPCPSQLMPRC